MCVEVVVWDLDDTVFYNILNANYAYYIGIYSPSVLDMFCRLNPLVNPMDVGVVLTARLYDSFHSTKFLLDKHGIVSDLIMYPHPVWTYDGMIEFKSKTLTSIGADYYIDDDASFCKSLQPLVDAICISTEDYYRSVRL